MLIFLDPKPATGLKPLAIRNADSASQPSRSSSDISPSDLLKDRSNARAERKLYARSGAGQAPHQNMPGFSSLQAQVRPSTERKAATRKPKTIALEVGGPEIMAPVGLRLSLDQKRPSKKKSDDTPLTAQEIRSEISLLFSG